MSDNEDKINEKIKKKFVAFGKEALKAGWSLDKIRRFSSNAIKYAKQPKKK
jgi:hypothetical protein